MTLAETKTHTAERKVLHPILEECSQLTLDPYWRQVFEECALGKFPRGCGIDSAGKVLYFKPKGGTNRNYLSYRLKDDPEQVFLDLKKIFHTELNLKSKQDRQDLRDELDDLCKDIQETYAETWPKIKRKKIKDPIVRRYILDLKEAYELDDKETAEVAQIIKMGFLFNWIPNENVIYQDRRILDIKNLHFDPEERTFELDEPDIDYVREYKPKLTKLSGLWQKHTKQKRNSYLL